MPKMQQQNFQDCEKGRRWNTQKSETSVFCFGFRIWLQFQNETKKQIFPKFGRSAK